MEELLRLDYLAAMGITQYVARAPLPGALPSENITLVALAEIKQPQSITSLLDNEEPTTKDHSAKGSRCPRGKKTAPDSDKPLSSGFPLPDCYLDDRRFTRVGRHTTARQCTTDAFAEYHAGDRSQTGLVTGQKI